MQQLERKVSITYRWWLDNREEINPEDIRILDDQAEYQIAKLRKEGMTSGDLFCQTSINHGGKTTTYRGFWELTTKTL